MIPVLGVDPGVKGGFCLLDDRGSIVYVCRVPETEDELIARVKLLSDLLKLYGGNVCFLEKVGFIKGDGGKGSFTFGGIYKALRVLLRLNGLVVRDVYPVVWQSSLNCLTGGNKNVSKRRACELFPDVKMTHLIADACLIAVYGWRVLNRQGFGLVGQPCVE